MKKFLLLIAASSSIGMSLNAQELNRSVIFSGGQVAAPDYSDFQPANRDFTPHNYNNRAVLAPGTANKTTAGGSRWYSYANYFDTLNKVTGAGLGAAAGLGIIWNDTIARVNYTSGIAHNTMVSVGEVFSPQFSGFYDWNYNDTIGLMKTTFSNAYTIDSINLWGAYVFNPAKTSVVDTLKISFLHGAGGGGTGVYYFAGWYGSSSSSILSRFGLAATDTLYTTDLAYDSVKNIPFGTSLYTFNVPLTSADWGDTLSDGTWVKQIKLPTALSVAAGEIVGFTVAFKTGDPTFPTVVTTSGAANDTILGITNPRYNVFRPRLIYKNGNSSTFAAAYPTYSRADLNTGMFKTLPNYKNGWDSLYIPEWAWGVTAASTLQHVDVDFHVNCATCHIGQVPNAVHDVNNTISSVTAMPNPANTELNISFNSSVATDATVTLSNTVGKVVGVQSMTNVKNGKATFNTSTLANGIYFYSVIANGERSTGRVVIAH